MRRTRGLLGVRVLALDAGVVSAGFWLSAMAFWGAVHMARA